MKRYKSFSFRSRKESKTEAATDVREQCYSTTDLTQKNQALPMETMISNVEQSTVFEKKKSDSYKSLLVRFQQFCSQRSIDKVQRRIATSYMRPHSTISDAKRSDQRPTLTTMGGVASPLQACPPLNSTTAHFSSDNITSSTYPFLSHSLHQLQRPSVTSFVESRSGGLFSNKRIRGKRRNSQLSETSLPLSLASCIPLRDVTHKIRPLPTPSFQLWNNTQLCHHANCIFTTSMNDSVMSQEVGPNPPLQQNFHPREDEILFHSIIAGLDKKSEIRPVHFSLLPLTGDRKRFCFSISRTHQDVPGYSLAINNSTSSSTPAQGITRYYITRCSHDQELWMKILKRAINPKVNQTRRVENSLRIWIQEAKQVPRRKLYYCEVYLDGIRFARTGAKAMSDMLLWAEEIDIKDLPSANYVTVCLRTVSCHRRANARGRDPCIGYINLPTATLLGREQDQWHMLQSPRNSPTDLFSAPPTSLPDNNKGASLPNTEYFHQLIVQQQQQQQLHRNQPMLRMRARWSSVNVLPAECYADLRKFLAHNCVELVQGLEQAGVTIPAKLQEEMCLSLVKILHAGGGEVVSFLATIIHCEINKNKQENLTLRGNSVATKSMEGFLLLLGDHYLQFTLGDFIQNVLTMRPSCEVDPARIAGIPGTEEHNAKLRQNQGNLLRLLGFVWARVRESQCRLPKEFRNVFISLRQKMESEVHQSHTHPNPTPNSFTFTETQLLQQTDFTVRQTRRCFHVISACLFLRLLCPAILSPSLFGLTTQYPDNPHVNRTLTLVAKALQSLANGTLFGHKEGYMVFMNEFLKKHLGDMRAFLASVSEPLPQFLFHVPTSDSFQMGGNGFTRNETNADVSSVQASPAVRNQAEVRFSLAESDIATPALAANNSCHKALLEDTSEYDGAVAMAEIDMGNELALMRNILQYLLKSIPSERMNSVLQSLMTILRNLDQCYTNENHKHQTSSSRTLSLKSPLPPPPVTANESELMSSTAQSGAISSTDNNRRDRCVHPQHVKSRRSSKLLPLGSAMNSHEIEDAPTSPKKVISAEEKQIFENQKWSEPLPPASNGHSQSVKEHETCELMSRSGTYSQGLQIEKRALRSTNGNLHRPLSLSPQASVAGDPLLERQIERIRSECNEEEERRRKLHTQLDQVHCDQLQLLKQWRSERTETAVNSEILRRIKEIENTATEFLCQTKPSSTPVSPCYLQSVSRK